MDFTEELNELAGKLLGHVEHGTTDQAEDILEVPVTAYTDPARFAREVELIFKRLPQFLGFSAELPRPNAYKTIEIVGVPVLVVRGQDGGIRAFMNVCKHRGAPIVEDSHGERRRFTCKYHGWTYANDGRLIGVAGKSTFGDFDLTCRGLTELPCVERAGMIFGILTPGLSFDFDLYFGGMLDEIAQYHLEDWYYVGSRELLGANWKVAYDGFLENYHFQTLHPNSIAPISISNVMQFKAYGPHLRVGFPGKTIEDLKALDRSDWHTEERRSFRTLRLLFPNLSMSLAYTVGQAAQVIPGPDWSQNRTILHHIAPQAPKDERERQALLDAGQWFLDVVRDEDYSVGYQVQKGLLSGAMDSVIFGRNERGNQHFHKWVEHYLEGGPEPRTI